MTDSFFLSVRQLREDCGDKSYERGKAYFAQGRVSRLSAERSGPLQLKLVGEVRGNQAYEVEVHLEDCDGDIELDGYCDCPVGYNCKHVVALCLAYATQSEPIDQNRAFERWLGSLGGQGQPDQKDCLLYQLTPGKTEVQVECKTARRLKSGDLGKERRLELSRLTYNPPGYLQPIDHDIVSLLSVCQGFGWGGTCLRGAAGASALELLVQSGRAFVGEQRSQPLRASGPRPLQLFWREDKTALRLSVQVEQGLVLATRPARYLDGQQNQVGELLLPEGLSPEQLSRLQVAPALPRDQALAASRLLAQQALPLPLPAALSITEIRATPTPCLIIERDANPVACRLHLQFDYGGQRLAAGGEPVETHDSADGLVQVHRDLAAEAAACERLVAEGLWQVDKALFCWPGRERGRQQALAGWLAFVDQGLARLREAGWHVQWRNGELTIHSMDALEGELLESGNAWFELRFDLQVNGQQVPLLPLVSHLLEDYRPDQLPDTLYCELADGQLLALARERLQPVLDAIWDLFDSGTGSLRLNRQDAPALLALGDTAIAGAEALRKLARQLKNFDGIKTVKAPSTFKGELRNYQQQGLNWLQFLRRYQLGGILADDMGLGKTVQTLAHLAVEKRAGRMDRPSLIVATTSLMGNWRREAAQFTPGLKLLVLHGPARAQHFEALADHDLVLTTYPLLARDAGVLQAQAWHYLILDEAQNIKNPRAQAARLVRQLDVRHRLCLTGTPLENHLGELWAQFDFLMPGFLGDARNFARRYRNPVEKQGDTAVLARLASRVAPFMLRRTKDRVAAELPAKTELLRSVPLDDKQALLYESIRLTMEKKIQQAIAKHGLARSHIEILDALLKLRQVCCDPRLLPDRPDKKTPPSAKLQLLMELLPELLAEGRRVLLFSQFTSMLALIEQELDKLGIGYAKLTGQTRRRDAVIDAFKRGEVNLFLISLKAGGVGLNLTEADTVIHYDPWWNPAVEAQATDRAHRIGQDKPVFVYKLITEATVEEKILDLQDKKRQLAEGAYQGDGDAFGLDAEALCELLAGN